MSDEFAEDDFVSDDGFADDDFVESTETIDELEVLRTTLTEKGYLSAQCIDLEAAQYLNSRLYDSDETEITVLSNIPAVTDRNIERVKEIIKTSRVSYSNQADERITLEDVSLSASTALGGEVSNDCSKFVRSAVLQMSSVDIDYLHSLYVNNRASLIERYGVLSDDIYKYIKTLVPILENSKKIRQNNQMRIKGVRNKVSEVLCSEEFKNAREASNVAKFRLLKYIIDKDGEFFTVCPECGKTFKLTNCLCTIITLKTEQAKPEKACLIGINKCECGTALVLRPEEYKNIRLNYDKDCRRAINSIISNGEMITSQVVSGISFGYLKDISPELFVSESSSETKVDIEENEKDKNFISDSEFKDAAEIFYKLLESKTGRFTITKSRSEKTVSRDIDSNTVGNHVVLSGNEPSIAYPSLQDKECVEGVWTKKDAAMFIAQYLGYSYNLEYKVALFSAVRFISDNSMLREAFSGEVLSEYLSDLTLLKSINGINSLEGVDINIRDTVSTILDKCSKADRDFVVRVKDSITVLERCVKRQEDINTRVFKTIVENKDVLCHIPRLKITNLGAKELLTICSSETKISLLDDVANMIIVRQYAGEYFKDWSNKYIERSSTVTNTFEVIADTQKALDGVRKQCETLESKYNTPCVNDTYNFVFDECMDNEKMIDTFLPKVNKCVNSWNVRDIKSVVNTFNDADFVGDLLNIIQNLKLVDDIYENEQKLKELSGLNDYGCIFTEFEPTEIKTLEHQNLSIKGERIPVRFVDETPLEYGERVKSGRTYLTMDKVGVLSEFIEDVTKIQLIHLFDDDFSLKTSFIYHLLMDNCDKSEVLPYYGVNSLQYNINKHSEPIIKSFQKSCEIWNAINKHYSEPLQSFFSDKVVKVTNTNISVNDNLAELDSVFGLYSSIGTALSNDFAAISTGDNGVDVENANTEIANAFGMSYVDLLHYFGVKIEE